MQETTKKRSTGRTKKIHNHPRFSHTLLPAWDKHTIAFPYPHDISLRSLHTELGSMLLVGGLHPFLAVKSDALLLLLNLLGEVLGLVLGGLAKVLRTRHCLLGLLWGLVAEVVILLLSLLNGSPGGLVGLPL